MHAKAVSAAMQMGMMPPATGMMMPMASPVMGLPTVQTTQMGMMPMVTQQTVPMTGMMPMMMSGAQTGMMMPMMSTGMMMPPQTGMMPMMSTGMPMMSPMMPMMSTGMPMMPQQQQQQTTTVVEDKKKSVPAPAPAPAPVQQEEQSPFEREKEDIKVSNKSHNKLPYLSVRRLNIIVEGNGKLDITQCVADSVSIEICNKGQVRIHHLTARRLEVGVSGDGFCKVGGQGGISTVPDQQIRVAERGVFDGRFCKGKNVVKNITGHGKAAVCETDVLRIVKKKF